MNHINHSDIISQHCCYCNLKLSIPPHNARQVVVCPRCHSQLDDGRSWSLKRLFILSITLLMLAPIAFWQPLISIHLLGTQIYANVIEGISLINHQGDPLSASIIAFCAIVAPLFLPIALIYLYIGKYFSLNLRPVLLVLSRLKEWVMLDVYLIGVGIAAIKLQDYASVFIGNGLIAFITMTLISLLILIHLNIEQLWRTFYPKREQADDPHALTCQACHFTAPANQRGVCQRCHRPLHHREPYSLQKTWAALIAAMILLFPANLMPISVVYINGQRMEDTIYSGVVSLIDSGNWPIAAIVFIASILVPFIKILIMILLLFSIQYRSGTDPVLRMKLLKFVSWIGRWSMLDLFVIALMMTLINRDQLMSFTMGPAALFFGVAVILTILAVEWLDSRLIWDSMQNHNQQNEPAEQEAILRKRARISPFWLLPLVAVFIAGWLLFQHWLEQGTEVTIEFSSAPGVVAGRTPIRYQGVEVGLVQSVTVSQDMKKIIVKSSINKDMKPALTAGTKFWLVTPKASLAGVSGLDALVGGNYIGMQPGTGEEQHNFIAQDSPPQLQTEEGQLLIYLTAKDLGSLHENSPIYYRKVPVGYISDYSILPDDKGVSIAAVIEKRYTKLVKENSQFWNVSGFQGGFDLNSGVNVKMESLSAVINGAIAFDSPSHSAPAQEGQQFVLHPNKDELKQDEQQHKQSLVVSLWSPETYGVNEGQPIVYRGVKVGKVLQRNLLDDKVMFQVAILDKYRHLILADTKFVANSRLDVQLGLTGIQFQGATPQEWLDGGIHLLVGKGKETLPETFPLYRSDDNAKAGITGSSPTTTITLNATTLPDIQAGSVVLYRQFTVGEIVSIQPTNEGFAINIHISSQYRHLLTKKSVFWAEGGAKVKLNSNGLTVQAAPLTRAIRGAISFDNIQSAALDSTRQHTLYPTETAAKAIGSVVTLTTFDASKLSEGMPIRYLGIDIGQIDTLKLSANNREVNARAILYPEYVQAFTKSGSRFAIVTPELSPAGFNNLDTLLQPYISAEPGRGNRNRYQFELQTANITDSRYLDGLTIVLDASEVGSIQVGTPLLFRGMEIGTVTGLYLGELSDRVYVASRIGKEYQYLIRDNTQFWISSGYNMSFGLTGGMIKSGTFKQFVRGGISLATPPTVPLAPKAKPDQHFILKLEPPKDWLDWGTSIPKQ